MAPNTFQKSTPPPVPQPGSFDPGQGRGLHNPDKDNETSASSCPFCRIASIYAPYDPLDPPPVGSGIIDPEATAPDPATLVVLSTPLLVAFLDIMPLSTGHVLLCPRAHRPKLTDATSAEAREMGRYLPVLSAAVARATGVQDWNVVQNNGAAAAQVVPHMHFHIIPRPELRDKGRDRFTSTMFGRGAREDRDDDEAGPLAERIRDGVAAALRAEEEGKAKL